MQKIIPHLWFDKGAKEAAEFYTSIFPESKIISASAMHDTPSGDVESVSFELSGYRFMSISAGPYFMPNPSISFMVNFDPSRDPEAREHLDALWGHLIDGGKALMPLQEYPFSKWYGWVQDKYGFSWQLILTNPEGEERPFIMPSLLFVGDVCGKAKEASDLYVSLFDQAKHGRWSPYPAGMEPDKEGTTMFTDFMLADQWFVAMDSAHTHAFAFNEAISLVVMCESQEEIDHYWESLSAVPAAERCGWLKDLYGVSWQIVPVQLQEMMSSGDAAKIGRVVQAFLKMKKFDITELERAAREG